MDLINRQDAIDRINKQREHLRPDVFPQDAIGDAAYKVCAEFIERLQPAQRWIPCSERLPGEEGQYLVTLDFSWGKEIEMGDWFNGEWVNPNSHVTVAWMELPTPWKSEVE